MPFLVLGMIYARRGGGLARAVTTGFLALTVSGCSAGAVATDEVDSVVPVDDTADGSETSTGSAGLWIDHETLVGLPTSGPAWEAVRTAALSDWDSPDLDDGNSNHDVQILAGALYGARTGDEAVSRKVEMALSDLTGSQPTLVLPLARNLVAYVIAADLIDYRSPEFTWWLRQLVDLETDGRAGISSLRQSAMTDPSNHGTHARASVLAVALFVEDDALTTVMAERFHDWLGRSGDGFVWKELDWQADPAKPTAINPPGSQIDSLPVDGVLPEEQRRSGGFLNPPPQEGYVWEALQGAVATAEMLDRAGYPAWEWQDRALLRAYGWLYEVNNFPAQGDDTWQVWLINRAYSTDFEVESPTRPGKNLGYTDWTHAG